MKWKKSPESLIRLFENVAPSAADVEHRKMFGYPCCFVQGNMFMGLHQDTLVLRLPQEERLKLIQDKKGKQFEPMQGRVMKEYVAISPILTEDKKGLALCIKKSLTYARALPKKIKK
jgi:TfoX/Sxy family transcriptional regulator of competence genes